MRTVLKARTIPEAFLERVRKNSQRPMYFTKRHDQWRSRTYAEALTFVMHSLAGLQRLNVQPGDKIAILAENREEWMLTDYAIQWMGAAVPAIYTTSSDDQIRYILEESQAQGLFVSTIESARRVAGLSLKFLKWIVIYDPEDKSSAPADFNGIRFVSHAEFLKDRMSDDEAERRLKSLSEDDLAILLYTSGTTGDPKGVMLTHRNFMSNIKDILEALPIEEEKLVLSFLPFSHIYERICHCALLFGGCSIYFAQSIELLVQNLQEVRPHYMTAVPRIFEKMYGRIQEKLKGASLAQRWIFRWALARSQKRLQSRLHGARLGLRDSLCLKLADILVFRKIRAITGGRSQLFISGGAPLSKEIAEFFFGAGFTILEGYGLSECCITACNTPETVRLGTVGKPFKQVEVSIAGDGEICVRGPMVMQGYFNNPKETAEVIDKDGWFHTGDIGEFDSDGYLKITDRKKDLIVLAAGKKVAPQPIENILKRDPLVESVCLVGDQRSYIIALIVPNLDLAKAWGLNHGVSIHGLQDCVDNDELRDHYQRLVDDINTTLPRYSTIKYFRLLGFHFSTESGELTPTLKLKRRIIQEKYKSLIDRIYAEGEQARV